MRLFLTGVSGYVGSILANGLAQMPEVDGITGIDIATPNTTLPGKVSFVKIDIRSPQLADMVAGHQVIVHTAFVVRWLARMPEAERCDINLNGIRNLTAAAVANKVQRFICFSSVAAYDPELVRGKEGITEDVPIGNGNSGSYYANDKAMAERLLTEALGGTGTILTLLRPAYIVGPGNAATVAYLRGLRDRPLDAVLYAGHDQRQQYSHEDDVTRAVSHAIRSEMPGAYNLVADDWLRWSDVLKTLGRKSTLTIPTWVARLWTTVSWRMLGAPIHPSWVDVALVDTTFDNAKLRAVGWRPRYSTDGALRAAL